MSLQQKADMDKARASAEEAWETWIKNQTVFDMKEAVKEVYVHGFYVGAQYGREQERGSNE